MKRITILVTLLVAGGLALAPPARADERTCTGSIGTATVDNLKVPDGATCRLDGTVVEGTIVVERGGTLVANGIRVDGNVQSEGHRQVDLVNSRVGGSVQLKQGGGATVSANAIDSDLQFDANGQRLAAASNTIGGNLQAFSNRGGLDVTGNTIDGNLQCKSNDPAPTGGGNVVHGSAEDQCANLQSGGEPSPTPGGSFCDTAGHAHETSIDKVAAAGVALGSNGCYRPNEPVTRGQMATFLQRGYSLADGASSFCDTAGHAHERGIGAVSGAGIALGSNGCYRPNEPVTRGQMATFLARAGQLPSGPASGFCDIAGHAHEASIDAVAAAGIALGSNGCFRPNEPVTRGQMATFLVRALQL